MASRTLKLGEVREIGIEITNNANQTFVIDAADYEIFTYDDKERTTPITNGVCEIQNHNVLMLFSATTKGQFVVVFTCRISPEILKQEVIVIVK